jgi:hypothetical protein
MAKKQLFAGAGKALLRFPEEAFPTAREDYVGIHDLPHVRVLILEGIDRYVIYNIEIVNVFPDTRARIVEALIAETGVKPENIWYHNCHVLSTPHAWKVQMGDEPRAPQGKGPKEPNGSPAMPRKPFQRTPQQQRSVELVSSTIVEATHEAARQAAAGMQAAKVGSGSVVCYANANRNLETENGWWVSCNDEGAIDHTVPILRVDRMDGTPIAVLFGFHAQPAVLDMVFLEQGGRLVSGDIAGYSTEFIENEYPEAVAMYFTGAGGDGTPYLRGDYYLRGRNGRCIEKQLHEKAYLLAEMLGERIGQQVLLGMERIETAQTAPVLQVQAAEIELPALKCQPGKPGRPEGPVKTAVLEQEGTVTIPISAMQIGDMGFLGLIPEIGQSTAQTIEEQSPFAVTMVSTFTNSGPEEKGGGKYMGEAAYYDRVTFQALNTMFAKGAAEQMAEKAVELLQNIKE